MNDVAETPADETASAAPLFRVVKGNPSDEDIAALVTILAGASGGGADSGPGDRNLWGHPVTKLRYSHTSWQLVTLLERTFIRH
jgi:Acyl-CoA carboxylase epsilon subunit